MKKIALLAVVAGALVMSSCNNSEKKASTSTDSAQTVGEHVDAAIADLKKLSLKNSVGRIACDREL